MGSERLAPVTPLAAARFPINVVCVSMSSVFPGPFCYRSASRELFFNRKSKYKESCKTVN